MEEKARNLEIERKIDAYIKGNLTEEEVDELWIQLLERPDYIEFLQTEIDVTRVYKEKKQRATTPIIRYWKWVAVAAAIVLLVVSINIFSEHPAPKPLQEWTLGQITLNENLSSVEVTRSATDIDSADSLLNAGFITAIDGNTEEAVAIYENIITQFDDPELIAKAYLNLGILRYNSSEYEQSIQNLKKAVAHTRDNALLKERSYWFMANGFVKINQLKPARSAVYQAYLLGELYKDEAYKLMKRLDYELGYIDQNSYEKEIDELE